MFFSLRIPSSHIIPSASSPLSLFPVAPSLSEKPVPPVLPLPCKILIHHFGPHHPKSSTGFFPGALFSLSQTLPNHHSWRPGTLCCRTPPGTTDIKVNVNGTSWSLAKQVIECVNREGPVRVGKRLISSGHQVALRQFPTTRCDKGSEINQGNRWVYYHFFSQASF